MKNYFIGLLLSVFLLVPAAHAFTAFSDVPGDGFASTDDCGYVTGSATSYNNNQVLADFVPDQNQLCFDENGQAFRSATRGSVANNSNFGPMNFAWSAVPTNNVSIDLTTGYLSGFSKLTSATYSANPLVWFDWVCDLTMPCSPADYMKFRPHVDLDTGVLGGYAWSPAVGFISFEPGAATELKWELPPRNVVVYVDILANDTDLGPADVDYIDAPMADGYAYWRVRVQFFDTIRGEFLDSNDFSYLDITSWETSDSNIYLNQIENITNAVEEIYANPVLPECASIKTSPGSRYCGMTERDGSWSANLFITSGGPTSNMLGVDENGDNSIDQYTDRDGCRWIYEDQWSAAGFTLQPNCPVVGGSKMLKDDVYYDRQNDRNQYIIDYIKIEAVFDTGTEVAVYEDASFYMADDDIYWYLPSDPELSYRPRFKVQKFLARYDGVEETMISEDVMKLQDLLIEATHDGPSIEMLAVPYVNEAAARASRFNITYQMDNDSDSPLQAFGDSYLILEHDGTGYLDPGDTTKQENYDPSTSPAGTYNRTYEMGYGQKYDECISIDPTTGEEVNICPLLPNIPSNPTAEMWVCDNITESALSDPSCYTVAYLPILDRHADPESMEVIGALNSFIDENEFLTESDDLSVLGGGAFSTITLRNKMYAQIARYTLGQTATGGRLNAAMEPSSGLIELVNSRMVYAQGDVIIEGSSSFADKTLVVRGGDVFIDGDITGGKLGIIALQSSGRGGNVFVHPDVTEIHANMFLDGSLRSYTGNPGAAFVWGSEDMRTELLKNQLYIVGSLVSRNTLNSASDPGAGTWSIGGGLTTSDYMVALQYDLQKLRMFRLCYGITATGTLDTSVTMDCSEGEQRSSYLDGSGLPSDAPLIIEYDPPGSLPIFTVESGFFFN